MGRIGLEIEKSAFKPKGSLSNLLERSEHALPCKILKSRV